MFPTDGLLLVGQAAAAKSRGDTSAAVKLLGAGHGRAFHAPAALPQPRRRATQQLVRRMVPRRARDADGRTGVSPRRTRWSRSILPTTRSRARCARCSRPCNRTCPSDLVARAARARGYERQAGGLLAAVRRRDRMRRRDLFDRRSLHDRPGSRRRMRVPARRMARMSTALLQADRGSTYRERRNSTRRALAP